MAWTKAKMAIVAAAVTLIVAGTATVVVTKAPHTIPASANSSQDKTLFVIQRDTGPDRGPSSAPKGTPGDPLLMQHNPNARFANLTPEQRVEQARQHYPESVEDLKK